MRIFYTLAISLVLTISFAFAQVPRLVHYQGELENAEGELFTGTTDLQIGIYKSPRAEKPTWIEIHTNVEIQNGIYSVMLGSQNPLKLSFYEYFLEAKSPDFESGARRKMIVGSGYNYRLGFLFSAYTIVWVAIFLFMLSIFSRQKKLINELGLIGKLQKEKASA